MPVIRKKVDNDFTIVRNKAALDKNLPIVAKGLLLTMLALPDDWHFSIAGLQTICADGQERISTALKILEKHGYLRRVKKVGNNGIIAKWEYYFSYEPIFLDPATDLTDFDQNDETHPENAPSVEQPSAGTPEVGTVPIYKERKDKERIDKELINKNISCGTAAQPAAAAAEQTEISVVVEVSKSESRNEQASSKAKSKKSIDKAVYEAIVAHLNAKAHTNYKATTESTRRLINARLAEGHSVEDFKTVIDRKCAEWLGSGMAQYLRPQTLFGTKFESYLNAPDYIGNNAQSRQQGSQQPPVQRDYSTNMIDLLNEYLGE